MPCLCAGGAASCICISYVNTSQHTSAYGGGAASLCAGGAASCICIAYVSAVITKACHDTELTLTKADVCLFLCGCMSVSLREAPRLAYQVKHVTAASKACACVRATPRLLSVNEVKHATALN